MKLSVSLSPADVAFLDAYARTKGHPSRSAAVQEAIALLRHGQLQGAYEDAWRDWDESGEASVWNAAADDGLAS